MLFFLAAVFLNRRGRTLLAGLLPIAANEALLCLLIILTPGGLQSSNLPLFDALAGFTLAASVLLPLWFVFPLALMNIGLTCALLLLLPKTPELQKMVAIDPMIFCVPIILQISVASFSFFGGHSCVQALQEADRVEEIRDLYREKARAALTDALTGLPNHRAVIEQLERELKYAQDSGEGLALIFFDVDYFKRINDVHGHLTGDVVLCQVGERASRVRRQGDLVGRFGGEEFLMVLPQIDAREALLIAERLRAAVAISPIATSEVEGGISLTVSIGIALYPLDGNSANTLLSLADEAMYEAKRLGRNQVRTAEQARLASLPKKEILYDPNAGAVR